MVTKVAQDSFREKGLLLEFGYSVVMYIMGCKRILLCYLATVVQITTQLNCLYLLSMNLVGC